MARVLQVVERNKADKIFRFINYLIDLALAIFVVWFVIAAYAILMTLIVGKDLEETATSLENVNPLLDRIITLLSYASVMFLIEKITNGRSLGKLITGTKVVKVDGSELTTEDLLKRNFSRAVPFDQFSFLGTRGWHDKWSDTTVVRVRDFEEAINLENDIQSIGRKEAI